MDVYNIDVAGCIRRMRRFQEETIKAASSGLANTSAADMGRAVSYLAAITAYLDHVVSQPQLDLPEWSPKIINLGEAEVMAMPENESLVDLMTLWQAMEVEIANSQSSRQATGIVSHDENRMRAIIAKAESFLTSYVAVIQPLDLPESAPLRDQTGPGRTGV